MEDKIQNESAIIRELCQFYEANKGWLTEYKLLAKNFDCDKVERKLTFDDLDYALQECTILVLTANSVEQNILTQKLYKETNANFVAPIKLSEVYADGCVYQIAKLKNINIVHIHPNSKASFTRTGSANAIMRALVRFRPKLIVSLGVAFGIDPTKQKLGDLLLSSLVIPYDVFNKDTDGEITLLPEEKYYTHEALNAWSVLLRNNEFSLEKEESNRVNLIGKEISFNWQWGAILSGGSVLSNEVRKRALLRAACKCGEENIIGGEMEGVGVYFECEKKSVPCIVIKGICDYGAEKNSWGTAIEIIDGLHSTSTKTQDIPYVKLTNDDIKDCVQAYAMDNAVEALLRLLRFDNNFLDSYSVPQDSKLTSILKKQSWKYRLKHFFSSNQKKYLRKFLPVQVYHQWVDFSLSKCDEENNIKISLLGSSPVYNVSVSIRAKFGRIKMKTYDLGNLNIDEFKIVQIPYCPCSKVLLQIDYELPNADYYIHIISENKFYKHYYNKQKINVYNEWVYLKEGDRFMLISKQKKFIDSTMF